jgi:accessory gene regulator B
MNLLDTTANYLANAIRNNNKESASQEVLFYSLVILLNTISIIFIVCVVGLFTGHFMECLTTLFMYALLRYFSGGVHLNSSITCIIVSSLLMLCIAHIQIPFWYAGFVLNMIALVIVAYLAPKGIENVSRIAPKYYPVLKLIATALVCSNFIFRSDLLSVVFFTQAIMLTTPVYWLVDLLERRGNQT